MRLPLCCIVSEEAVGCGYAHRCWIGAPPGRLGPVSPEILHARQGQPRDKFSLRPMRTASLRISTSNVLLPRTRSNWWIRFPKVFTSATLTTSSLASMDVLPPSHICFFSGKANSEQRHTFVLAGKPTARRPCWPSSSELYRRQTSND